MRIHSLQSALGAKLNNCEGVVESWNAATCRWQVRITGVGTKAIRDENLEPLNPGSGGMKAPDSASDTIAIYRLLCQDGVTAVHESDFQAVMQRLLPQNEEQVKKFFWLLPKCPDGKVDVPEALAQLERGFDQTLRAGQLPGGTKIPAPKLMPTIKETITPGLAGGPATPNFVAGPGKPRRAPVPSPSPRAAQAGQIGHNPRGEAAVLRLSQHLLGRRSPGPGVDVLRLFARNPDVVTLEEAGLSVVVLRVGCQSR